MRHSNKKTFAPRGQMDNETHNELVDFSVEKDSESTAKLSRKEHHG